MTPNIKDLVKQMTLEEKASLCSGLDLWNTKPIDRLGIPSIMMTDGPHGLRKQSSDPEEFGLDASVPATCFPTAAGLASTWNRDLVSRVGVALGEECQAENVSIILGPGANIKRSPLCGRNFEYFSEDPYLATEMATHHIKGVQSQGVGTSLKHFAVNNQETLRMSIDAVMDERTLREIYLASFEGAVKQGQPWTVMCSYNRVNGEFASQNPWLLTKVLRDDWGFQGLVVSDWGAVDRRVPGLAAGLDLEMPASGGVNDRQIVEAVKSGELLEAVLDQAVERILTIIFRAVESHKAGAAYDKDAHHRLAREVEQEAIVLLKNEGGLLPLHRHGSLAVIGELAVRPKYQGGGSSHIHPTRLDNPLAEIQQLAGKDVSVAYAQGYFLDKDDIDDTMLQEAVELATRSDNTVIFAGLPDRYESEGYDRTHLCLPGNQIRLIEAVCQARGNVVVVLFNGSPVEMPWLGEVKALLTAYMGGQAVGGAVADILYGAANPSGKLTETYPQCLEHNPSYLNFPGDGSQVHYSEGIFVGYRYYDRKNIEPLFPFGYGLSYTTFDYSDLALDKDRMRDTDALTVTLKVKNTGPVRGKEIVQLYVGDVASWLPRPEKELKGFAKVDLAPGEETTVRFTLGKRAFAYYNTEICDWHVESGEFEILVGRSSRDIVLRQAVTVETTAPLKKIYTRYSSLREIAEHPAGAHVVDQLLAQMAEHIPAGLGADIREMFLDNPLRSIPAFSGGRFSEVVMEDLLKKLNS